MARQHGHGRIVINDAADYKIRLSVGDFFLRPAVDRALVKGQIFWLRAGADKNLHHKTYTFWGLFFCVMRLCGYVVCLLYVYV